MHETDEIEITPEMIEAGAVALLEYDNRFDSYKGGARVIFEAMMSVAPRTFKNAKRKRPTGMDKLQSHVIFNGISGQ